MGSRFNLFSNPVASNYRANAFMKFYVAATLTVSIVLAGCSSLPQKSDFPNYDRVDNTPVVFVHGLFGSKIRDKESGIEVWPGSLYRLMTRPFALLGFKISPDLKPDLGPYEAFATYMGVRKKRFNQTWGLLQEVGGYQRGYAGEVYGKNDRRYYFFVYDWRKDLVDSARELDLFIERIRESHQDPNLKVNLVAHSLGGQVVRYFLAYGSQDVLNDGINAIPTYEGKRKTKKVIYMAVPLDGSLIALRALVRGHKMGFSRIPPEQVVAVASIYQILPAPGNFWVVDESGNDLNLDLYDIDVWKEYEWSLFSPKARDKFVKKNRMEYYPLLVSYMEYRLKRARLFYEVLKGYTGEDEYTIYSNCKPTLGKALLDKKGKLHFQEIPNMFPELLRATIVPGDKVVPYKVLKNIEMFTVCSTHNKMWNNPKVAKALIQILLGRK